MRGHVRKRNGGYTVVIDLPRDPATGKRRQLSRAAGTRKKDADALLSKLLHDPTYGEAPVPAPVGMTLDDQVALFFATDGQDLRPTTRQSYRLAYQSRVQPSLGATPISDLTPLAITRWVAAQRALGFAPNTIAVGLSVLRGALGMAYRLGQLAANPCAGVKTPGGKPKRPIAFDPAQIRVLLRVIEGNRHADLYRVVLGTGLRMGEALGLRWSDVDLDQATLTVRRQQQRTKDEGILWQEPKTDASKRTVTLPGIAVDALRAHRAKQNAERLRLGELWEDTDLVFCTAGGAALPATSLRNHYKQAQAAMVEAGLPRLTFHGLRHQHASLEMQAGVHPKIVSERLGHSSVAITLDVYTHSTPAGHREAATLLDDLLDDTAKFPRRA